MTRSQTPQDEEIVSGSPSRASELRNVLAGYIQQLEKSQKAIHLAATQFRQEQRFDAKEIGCMMNSLRTVQNITTQMLLWIREPEARRSYTSSPSPLVGVELTLTYLDGEETIRLLLHLDAFREICQSTTTERINKHLTLHRLLLNYHSQLLRLIEE